MPSAINPKRIEDEVFERLSYREDCDIDDFTMNKFYHGLKKTIADSKFIPETFIALGFVLFNMNKYKEFLEVHDQGKRQYPHNLVLHTHRLLGMLRLVTQNLYVIPEFDLYSLWFDRNVNINNAPFTFDYGSKRLVFAGQIMTLKRNNVAKVVIYEDRTISVEFGPFNFTRNYDDMKDDDLFFDESFTWEVVEKIRTNTLTDIENLYLKDVLGDRYDDFMSLADPDYSGLINEDNKSEGDETYNSVDEFMESLMI